MTPSIRRLQKIYPELFSLVEHDPFAFKRRMQELSPDFYRKIIPFHLELHLEYNLLGQQFLTEGSPEQNKQAVDQLITALNMAELLKHIYQYYLIVPREVSRFKKQHDSCLNLLKRQNLYCELRKQKNLYHELLAKMNSSPGPDQTAVTLFSQRVRHTTMSMNLYRILFIRSKRALELVAILNAVSKTYRHFVKVLDRYTGPFLTHLSWLFFLPRVLVNLFLLLKHTIPGLWMREQEKSLGWTVRFKAQMQRRWFELGNDLAWASVGAINCFLLVGALSPIGAYLALAVFAYDVVLSAVRVYVELSRLYALRKHYWDMQNTLSLEDNPKELKRHLAAIENQIKMERFRLISHWATTVIIFLAMSCVVVPLFAFHPIIPLIGGIILVAVALFNIALFQINKRNQPKDTIKELVSGGINSNAHSKDTLEKPADAITQSKCVKNNIEKQGRTSSKVGFFAKKEHVVKEHSLDHLYGSKRDGYLASNR